MFFSERIDQGNSPFVLKHTNVKPVFKEGYKVTGYRPARIPSITFRIFEKLLHKQMTLFMEQILSKHQRGFCKRFNAQHFLLGIGLKK